MKFFTLVFSSSIYCAYALKIHSTLNNQSTLNIQIPEHRIQNFDEKHQTVKGQQMLTNNHQTQKHSSKGLHTQRSCLSQDEIDQLRQAFDLFDTQESGRVDPKQLKAAMQSLGYAQKNPTIYGIIGQLDTPQNAKKGGVEFDEFVQAINNKMGDKQSREGIRRIFNLFIDDPNQNTITLSSLRRIARELGQAMTNEQLRQMLTKASSNGTDLTFEQFYDIMTKKSF